MVKQLLSRLMVALGHYAINKRSLFIAHEDVETALYSNTVLPLFWVDISKIRDSFNYKFRIDTNNLQQINPILLTLHLSDGSLQSFKKSPIYRHFKTDAYNSLAAMFSSSNPITSFIAKKNVDNYSVDYSLPWEFKPMKTNKKYSPYFGVKSDKYIKEEYKRIFEVYKSIKRKGYKPTHSGKLLKVNHITGYLLKKQDDYRFIVLHGKHRLAALVKLGYTKVPVSFQVNRLKGVFDSDAKNWPSVTKGKIELNEAKQIFNMFFS